MKWSGQNIYDFISRFRNDIYLEDISTGTIASGAHLGLDSNNKIVKAVDGGGDLTGITAGTGLSGTDLTGPVPTLNVDAAQTQITSIGTITTGVWNGTAIANAYLDADTAHLTTDQTFTGAKTFSADVTFNGDTATFSSANADDPVVIIENTTNDAQAARLQFKKHRGVDAVDGDNIGEIEFWGYDDGTPSEQLYGKIFTEIHDATSGEESGKMGFLVANHDGGTNQGLILTGGSVNNEVDVTVGLGAASVVTIPGNIDLAGDIDVDGTLETDALTIGGATIAAVGTTSITTLGTIGTGVWQGTAIASAYLDSDTAHLSGAQIFTGAKKFNEISYAIFDGDKSVTPGDGAVIHVDNHEVTDEATSASGTAAKYTHVNIESPRLLATNSSVTTTAAATLYINSAPAPGTNQTITNAYALWVDDGLVKFDAALTVGGTITGDVTGDLTGQADTVATIAGLAPNTATTQATQAAITTCANLATVGTITTGVWNGTAIASAYLDSDTAHLSGTQTFTGAKTFTDTVALTGTGRITGVDTVSADTDAASKVYADRPAKQIQIYHANWKGAAGTGLTYIPLAGVPDEAIGSGGSVGARESNALIMPAAGKIKEIILRQHWASTITTSDDITWTVYNRASNKKMNAFSAIGSTFDMVNPTQGGTDANNTRTSGEISYDFAEYDAVAISMQWASTGPTNNSDRHFVTVVVEYDYTGIGY